MNILGMLMAYLYINLYIVVLSLVSSLRFCWGSTSRLFGHDIVEQEFVV